MRNFYFNSLAPERPADVWITGGDNDQTDGTDAHYSDSVFGATYAYSNLLRTLPVWPAMGNHDYQTSQGTAYYANFSMPTNGESGGRALGNKALLLPQLQQHSLHLPGFDRRHGLNQRRHGHDPLAPPRTWPPTSRNGSSPTGMARPTPRAPTTPTAPATPCPG